MGSIYIYTIRIISTLGCITYGPQPQLHTTMQHISTVCSCSALKILTKGAYIRINLDRRKRNTNQKFAGNTHVYHSARHDKKTQKPTLHS